MGLRAYCVKCKEKDVTIQGAVISRTKRGGYIAKGTHTCGTKVCAILSKENAEKAISEGVKSE